MAAGRGTHSNAISLWPTAGFHLLTQEEGKPLEFLLSVFQSFFILFYQDRKEVVCVCECVCVYIVSLDL